MPQGKDVSVRSQPEKSPMAATMIGGSVNYRDKAFKSRTMVFADGSTLVVEKGVTAAVTQEQMSALDRHSDFERIADGA